MESCTRGEKVTLEDWVRLHVVVFLFFFYVYVSGIALLYDWTSSTAKREG